MCSYAILFHSDNHYLQNEILSVSRNLANTSNPLSQTVLSAVEKTFISWFECWASLNIGFSAISFQILNHSNK
jgi:hypothetical protein